jgi:hypothetical protein
MPMLKRVFVFNLLITILFLLFGWIKRRLCTSWTYKGKKLIDRSTLGLVFQEEGDFADGLDYRQDGIQNRRRDI